MLYSFALKCFYWWPIENINYSINNFNSFYIGLGCLIYILNGKSLHFDSWKSSGSISLLNVSLIIFFFLILQLQRLYVRILLVDSFWESFYLLIFFITPNCIDYCRNPENISYRTLLSFINELSNSHYKFWSITKITF